MNADKELLCEFERRTGMSGRKCAAYLGMSQSAWSMYKTGAAPMQPYFRKLIESSLSDRAMRESLAELLRFTIAERDTFYECCSDPDGVMQDEDD